MKQDILHDFAESARTPKPERSLVSQSSILILSGALLGGFVRDIMGNRFDRNLFLSAMVGVVAYIGLAYAGYIRQRRQLQRAFDSASGELETRIERYIALRSRIGSQKETPSVDDPTSDADQNKSLVSSGPEAAAS